MNSLPTTMNSLSTMNPGLLFNILKAWGSLIPFLLFLPLSCNIVRVRANYNPKSLQLDLGADGVVNPSTDPQVTSYFGMLARVKRIEGWSGLYKGLMPTIITMFVSVAFTTLLLRAARLGGYDKDDIANLHNKGPFILTIYIIFWTLVSVPWTVIFYRSITTPYRLPYFRPMYSLRVLLTATERRRPWMLYLTPGLLASQIADMAWVALAMSMVRGYLSPPEQSSKDFSTLRIVFYLAFVVFGTVVRCPLQVMIAKLAIQRNHMTSEYNSVSQEAEVEKTTEYSATEYDVVRFREERDPYTGLLDCAKRVTDEEGIGALYRVWWITLLTMLGPPLAAHYLTPMK